MESILWSAPLVYRAVGQSQSLVYEKESDELACLTVTTLYFQGDQSIALYDVAGVEAFASESCLLKLHTYSVQNRHYTYTPYTFACPDAMACQHWVEAINSALSERWPQRGGGARRRSLTILLNPKSGKGKSSKIWREIKPIFKQAGCQVEVIQTKSGEDLKQCVHTLDLETCSGLVILGGDGSIFYGVNGLMSRGDRDEAIKLPLGFIPTGTSNGLVKSILDSEGLAYSAQNAAVAIALGNTRSLDLIQVTQAKQQYFSILSLSWGFFSDVDIESDRMKGLGFLKNYVYTLFRLITYRTYSGLVEIKTDGEWQTLPMDLITLWTMNVAWAAYNFKPAPEAKINDGFFDVWITPKTISRWSFLCVLLKAFDGQHLTMKGVNYYKVQALKITPDSQRGIFALDGEPIAYTPIKLEVFPQPLSIFTPSSSTAPY